MYWVGDAVEEDVVDEVDAAEDVGVGEKGADVEAVCEAGSEVLGFWDGFGDETVSISGVSPLAPPLMIVTMVPAARVWAVPPTIRVAPPAPAM